MPSKSRSSNAAITRRAFAALPGALLAGQSPPLGRSAPKPKSAEIVSTEKVWSAAPHSAFTDLIRYHGRFFLAFREGKAHVSEDGAIRILTSEDALRWDTAALHSYPVADLRDPKLCVTPDGRLMLTAAAAMHPPADFTHHTMVWHSSDGRDWSAAERIGEPNIWIWRVQWHEGRGYGFGYSTGKDRFVRVYMTTDGRKFQILNPRAYGEDTPSEASIAFLTGDHALCLLRRESTALVGRSRPPYRGWTWQDAGTRIGGPHILRLDDGRILAAGRLYDGRTRTSLCWLDPERPAIEEFLRLPSGGDTSYPGLVLDDEFLYVSYYSSHENKSCIYLSKVKLPPIA